MKKIKVQITRYRLATPFPLLENLENKNRKLTGRYKIVDDREMWVEVEHKRFFGLFHYKEWYADHHITITEEEILECGKTHP